MGEWETVTSPDCTNKGSEQRKCSRCDYTETRDLDPRGIPGKLISSRQRNRPARRTEVSPFTAKCDAVKDSAVIPALGHDLGEWEVVTAPTCTENGSEKRMCSRCDFAETREMAALGHVYGNGL